MAHMSMNENDYLKQIDDLAKQIPKPSVPQIEQTRYLAEWGSLMIFLAQSLGSVDKIVMDEFQVKIGSFYSTGEAKRQEEWGYLSDSFKNGFVLLRDWVKRKFKYANQAQVSSGKQIKEWLYWTNGKVAYLQITGKVFPLNVGTQVRGKQAAVHLMDLLSFPHSAFVTEVEFKRRMVGSGEAYSETKSNTFKEAVLLGKRRLAKSSL
jgi:hypothetical protein